MTRASGHTRSLFLPALVFAAFACCSRTAPAHKTSTGGASGGVSLGAGGGGAGGAGTAGLGDRVCTTEATIPEPNAARGCHIEPRPIDPASTCAKAPCPITKALDVSCESHLDRLSLSATIDGAVSLWSNQLDTLEARARLLMVTASDHRVEEVPPRPNPDLEFTDYVGMSSALSVSASGTRWLFAGSPRGITILRGKDAAWTGAKIHSSSDLLLLDAKMDDDRFGHIAYQERGVWTPRLASWDGSCWTDRSVGDTGAATVVVDTDAQRRLWLGWVSYDRLGNRSLHLRHPDGHSRSLDLSNDGPSDGAPLRLLPGGLDGLADSPALLARFKNGIRVVSEDPASPSGWLSLTVPESGIPYTGTNDCPSTVPTFEYSPDLCAGKTTCTVQASGVGTGFGLARTQSGAVFAAWVEYVSEGTYALAMRCSGELARCACEMSQLGGTGTAKLVVARLTGAAPTLSRFAFPLSSAVSSLQVDLAMVARGETLVLAGYLSGDLAPTMTYLEIDSQQLP